MKYVICVFNYSITDTRKMRRFFKQRNRVGTDSNPCEQTWFSLIFNSHGAIEQQNTNF